MDIKIIWGDIVREKTDALVTLASKDAKVGSGVDKVVHSVAGPKLLEERLSKVRKMGPGLAVHTNSYGLRKTCGAKHVIHIAGVFWEQGKLGEVILIDAAYLKACAIANMLKAKVVTFPVMGAGKYNVPKETALKQAVLSLSHCAEYFPGLQIKLVAVEAEVFEIAKKFYPQLCESHFSAEEEAEFTKKFPYPKPGDLSDIQNLWLYSKDDPVYWKNFKLRLFEGLGTEDVSTGSTKGRKKRGNWSQMVKTAWDYVRSIDATIRADIKKNSCASKYSGLSRPLTWSLSSLGEVSGVSVSTLKHIMRGESSCPSREVVLALSVALCLPFDYICILMKTCGYTFKSKDEKALIKEYADKHIRAVGKLNDALKNKKCAALNKETDELKLDKEQLKREREKFKRNEEKKRQVECVPKRGVCKKRQ